MVSLYVNNNATYFDSFGVEQIPKEIKAFISCSLSITNISRILAFDSIMCGYFCIRFIDFMLKGKTLAEFTNLFSPNNFKKNDNIKAFYKQCLNWLNAFLKSYVHVSHSLVASQLIK